MLPSPVRRAQPRGVALGRSRAQRLPARRGRRGQPPTGLLRARRRGPGRLLPLALHARVGGRNGPPGIGHRDHRSARPGLSRPGPHHAPRRGDATAARLAGGEGERGSLHVDAGPVRDRGDGQRGGSRPRGVLGADHPRLLPRQPRPGGPLAGGRRAPGEHPRAPRRAPDRERPRRRARRRPEGRARGGPPLARWQGAQHSQLRDLHQPRLAGHRGLDPLRPAAVPLRQPRPRHPPEVRRRSRGRGRRRRERARAEGDDRHRGSGPDRRVLADRPALLADHALHGPDPLRRERRGLDSGTPTSPSAAPTRTPTPATPGSSRRRTGSGSGSTTRASTPTSSRRASGPSPPRCGTDPSVSSTATASSCSSRRGAQVGNRGDSVPLSVHSRSRIAAIRSRSSSWRGSCARPLRTPSRLRTS